MNGQPPPQQAPTKAEHMREPCPHRILDDIGSAFSMGCVGSAFYHILTGSFSVSKGERFRHVNAIVRRQSPITGGSFALWGATFSSCDCTLMYLRQKEDGWNSIAAGAVTGGLLSIRNGPRAMLTSAMFGGLILSFIEGINILLSRQQYMVPPPGAPPAEGQPNVPL